jgi:hypothetical protein
MITQSRTVESSAFADAGGLPIVDDNSDVAPDFSPFNATEPSFALSDNGSNIAIANADVAEQTSTITTNLVIGFGETRVQTTINPGPNGSANGTAISNFFYKFSIDSIFKYTLDGEADKFGPVSDAGVELFNTDSMFQVIGIGEPVGYVQTVISTSGVLNPGTYQLSAFADTSHNITAGLSSGAEFDFQFTLTPIPEPCTLTSFIGALVCILPGCRRRV